MNEELCAGLKSLSDWMLANDRDMQSPDDAADPLDAIEAIRTLTAQLQGATIMAEGFKAQLAEARAEVARLREALRALLLQALQSDCNSPANEWGQEAIDMARAALQPKEPT